MHEFERRLRLAARMGHIPLADIPLADVEHDNHCHFPAELCRCDPFVTVRCKHGRLIIGANGEVEVIREH